jgi:hypothetical protein
LQRPCFCLRFIGGVLLARRGCDAVVLAFAVVLGLVPVPPNTFRLTVAFGYNHNVIQHTSAVTAARAVVVGVTAVIVVVVVAVEVVVVIVVVVAVRVTADLAVLAAAVVAVVVVV